MEIEPTNPFELKLDDSPEIDPLTGKKKKKKGETAKKGILDDQKPLVPTIEPEKAEAPDKQKVEKPEPEASKVESPDHEAIFAEATPEITESEAPIDYNIETDTPEPDVSPLSSEPQVTISPEGEPVFEVEDEEDTPIAPIITPVSSGGSTPPTTPSIAGGGITHPPTTPRPPLGPTGGGDILPPSPVIAPEITPEVTATALPEVDNRRVLGSLLIGGAVGALYEHRKHKKREKRKAREHKKQEAKHDKLRKEFEDQKFANKSVPAVEVFTSPGIEQQPANFEAELAKLQEEKAIPPAEIRLSGQRFEKQTEEREEEAMPALESKNTEQTESEAVKTEKDIEIHQETGLENSLPGGPATKTASLSRGSAQSTPKDLGKLSVQTIAPQTNNQQAISTDSEDQEIITEPIPNLIVISAGIVGAILLILILLLALF